ncbi:MAG: phosphoribosylaminoimidazolesuccinocarboxamide synthase [Chlorobiales bacterium]|nr:phosphoribosylaminoimidazolesuccinocarboxamide synthase [Chlorobiales bacterium]
MTKGKQLYEGKAKKVFETDNPDLIIQEFKDDASAFNALKLGKIAGKGVVNNDVSCRLFAYLQEFGIQTHFVEKLSEREMLCKRLDIIKVEVVMRNIAAGSLVKRYGFIEGTELPYPIVELYLKNDALGDPLMNEYHATLLGIATAEELETLKQMGLKINGVLRDFFAKRELRLVDFKLEFGRHKGEILLGDEISPDTCRFWDAKTGEKLDKDRFRFDLGHVEEAYQEVHHRVFK